MYHERRSMCTMNNEMLRFLKKKFSDEFMQIRLCKKAIDVDKCISGDGPLLPFSVSKDLGKVVTKEQE